MPKPSFSPEKVIDIIYQSGKNLIPHFGNTKAIRYKTNSVTDSVTELDIRTEEFIRRELRALDRSIGFKGEELGTLGNSDRFWLIDPIDGTEFFRRGVWGCTNMLALIEEGKITFSIIYDFVTDSMYYAQKGKGAFSNKRKIRVSQRGLKNALIYVEINIDTKKNLSKYLELDRVCLPLRGYPSGIHFTLAASGKVEGRIGLDPWGKDYDFAPGQLLVQEAGGIVRNIGKDTFDYKNLNYLAVNQEVYENLTTGKTPIFPIPQ
ncbi:MAG: hypothetical protein ACD_37C00205G0001 [uncultured bacterium]|nr:MAG: hypothetical protein ACD_37C00205G0001 [uncultured bacterium]